MGKQKLVFAAVGAELQSFVKHVYITPIGVT